MDKKEKIIRVAILSDEILGWGSGKHYFHVILDNYSWESDDIIYRFKTISVSDDEIVQGKICVDDFDTFLIPGGGVGDGHALTKAVLLSKKTTIWKKTIAQFVRDGGGYIGICGGAALMTNLKTGTDGFPRTLLERLYAKSALGVSAVHSYYNKLAAPLWYLFQYTHPDKIGAAGYVFSFSPGVTDAGLDLLSGGVPVDCTIERDNPIFSDFSHPTQRMRWWGGPAFIVPDDPDRLIRVLARYPKLDFSSEEKTRIYAWRYVGGIVGLVKGFFKGLKYVKTKKSHLQILR